jgi:hypothetical protein
MLDGENDMKRLICDLCLFLSFGVMTLAPSCSQKKQIYTEAILPALTSSCVYPDSADPFDSSPPKHGPEKAMQFIEIYSKLEAQGRYMPIQESLQTMGYEFPDGTIIYYDNAIGCLVMKHTKAMIQRIKDDFRLEDDPQSFPPTGGAVKTRTRNGIPAVDGPENER